MPNPPDKWVAFSTKGMTSPDQLATMLSNLQAQNFDTKDSMVVPSPVDEDGIVWIAIPGYIKQTV